MRSVSPVPADPFDEVNEASRAAALSALLRLGRTRVGYDEIEAAMEVVGIDPFSDGDTYQWLIEQLEARSILVADGDVPDAPDVATLERLAEQTADEVVNLLDGIVDAQGDHLPPLLTAQEERDLLQIVRDGARAEAEMEEAVSEEHAWQLQRRITAAARAFDELIVRNTRLVYSIALRYAGRSRQLDIDDLAQEGTIGLMTAIRKFDLDVNTRLSTYAIWWIRQAITRAIADRDRTIRLPVHMVETINRLKMAEYELHQALARAPTEEELARALGLLPEPPAWHHNGSGSDLIVSGESAKRDLTYAVKRVRAWQRIAAGEPISIDQPVGDGAESQLGDFISAPESMSPAWHYEQLELRRLLKDLLAGLKQRERQILEQRFGLDGGEIRTLEEIGQQFGVTRERIRQIEAKALKRLRHPLRSRKVRDYLET